MRNFVERLRARNELSHNELVGGLIGLDLYLCNDRFVTREGVFDKLGVHADDRVVYRAILKQLHLGKGAYWKMDLDLPEPVVILGVPKNQDQTITLDQGVGRARGIKRTILPQGMEHFCGGNRQIFYLDGKDPECLYSFFGEGRATWFGGDSFKVVHTRDGEVIKTDYCFEIGGGYWGSRGDLNGEQIEDLRVGGQNRRGRVSFGEMWGVPHGSTRR